MWVRTLKRFRDMQNNVIREKGEEFICSEERFNEICKKNSSLVEPVADSEERKQSQEESDGESDRKEKSEAEADRREDSTDESNQEEAAKSSGSVCDIAHNLESLSKKELQDLAKEKGIKGVSGMNRITLLEALK